MSKTPTTGSGVKPPPATDTVAEQEVMYEFNPITETVMHRIVVWDDSAKQFDDAVNEAAARIHEAGNRITSRVFHHVTGGDRELVLICHLTYHTPIEVEDG